ncbi:MAG TPA: hypothetical protein VD866_30940 [Urbifossiella sp.]|nr:hypothetical protein [Urbifossiella sp.]
MRYAAAVLLLASPALADEPSYSWRTRVDEPDRVYLYRDGTQIGGWDYLAKQYRPFDGRTWGPAVDAAPVPPPANRLRIVPPPPPTVVVQPSLPPLPPLRGPLRNRAATVMTHAVTDMTVKMFEAIPGAVVESVKRGDYQLDLRYSVTPPAPAPEGGPAPPGTNQPVRNLLRRLATPRPTTPPDVPNSP